MIPAPRPQRRAILAGATALLLGLTVPATARAVSPGAGARAATRHVVAYYQTQYVTNSDGTQSYVSPLPLAGIATDVEVAAFHLNSDGSVHLNDDPPSASKFTQMWADVAALQSGGVRAEAMLGGAGTGSFANLHANFGKFYALLRTTLRTYHLNGVDLDIEEPYSLADTEHLINQLRTDFGSGFVIALAPVATDLSGGSRFSGGFNYRSLEKAEKSKINWYNTQFYCGWGDLSSTASYDQVVANGFAPARVVAGTVTNAANCDGYIDPATLTGTIASLTATYPTFAGVAGWEYFNSVGVNGGGPETWYGMVRNAMN